MAKPKKSPVRKPRYVTETCSHCRRPGWKHEVSYALKTEAEQYALFGDRLAASTKEIEGAPDNAEKCWPGGGAVSIYECTKEGVELAKQLGRPVAFEFNGQTVVCYGDSDYDAIVRDWWQKVYGETPEESYARR